MHWFLHWQNEDKNITAVSVHVKCLAQCQAHSKCLINVSYYYQIFTIHQALHTLSHLTSQPNEVGIAIAI